MTEKEADGSIRLLFSSIIQLLRKILYFHLSCLFTPCHKSLISSVHFCFFCIRRYVILEKFFIFPAVLFHGTAAGQYQPPYSFRRIRSHVFNRFPAYFLGKLDAACSVQTSPNQSGCQAAEIPSAAFSALLKMKKAALFSRAA
ncbi:hypothetical protein [Candidatus Soleaferrea massiliensis]|uniref:hypothetical protein n=1 Tax=Candidatus Soleaferrea massiliensis TaxID=1470354 RepID=UPI0012E03948|nr:hypothetical protein [Candidatus Soleaferrea massiliensis]